MYKGYPKAEASSGVEEQSKMRKQQLVGEFEKYWWNWIISPSRGENKKSLKPPTRQHRTPKKQTKTLQTFNPNMEKTQLKLEMTDSILEFLDGYTSHLLLKTPIWWLKKCGCPHEFFSFLLVWWPMKFKRFLLLPRISLSSTRPLRASRSTCITSKIAC